MLPFDLLLPHAPDRRGREPEVNAWIELHNLIVAADSVDDFGPESLARIRRQRGVDLRDRFYAERVRFYERALGWTIHATSFLADDRKRLAAIARTLALDADGLARSHERAFGIAVHEAISDDRLSADERLLLHKLQHTLGLDPDLADGAFEILAREQLLVTVARVLADGECSPEEVTEVEQVCHALSVTLPVAIRQRIQAAAEQWHLCHTPVPREEVVNGSDRVEYSVRAKWRGVLLRRLSQTRHVPLSALHGSPRHGRVLVTPTLFILASNGRQPRGHSLGKLKRVRQFQNGVLVEVSTMALLIESKDSEDLARALRRAMRTMSPLSARWRVVRPAERKRIFRTLRGVADEMQRYRAALPRLASSGEWSSSGKVGMRRMKLRLKGADRAHTLIVRRSHHVFLHGRYVWLVRPGAQDWLFEFHDATSARRFVDDVR
ncbi:MAG: hypothetical protein AAF791_02185 [Bacteroidota bacterium]